MSRKEVVYVTGDSYSNTGDVAMVVGFVSALTKEVPSVHVTFLGHDLDKMALGFKSMIEAGHSTAQSFSLVASQQDGVGWLGHVAKSLLLRRKIRPSLPRTIAYLKKPELDPAPSQGLREFKALIQSADVLVFGGGGYMNDVFHLLRPAYATCIAAHAQNKPIFAVSQSVGPFHQEASKQIMREIVGMCRKVELREGAGSMMAVKELGLEQSVELVADNAMLLSCGDPQPAKELIASLFPGQQPERVITLNPRYLPESNKGGNLEDHIRDFTVLMQRLIDTYDCHVIGIPSLYKLPMPGAVEKPHFDRPVSCRIKEGLKDPLRMAVLEEPLSTEEVKAIHSHAFFSLGVGYHPCMFAMSVGTPTILLAPDLYYKIKNQGLAEQFGAGHLVVESHDEGWIDAVMENAKLISETREELRAALLQKSEELAARAQRSVKAIADTLLTGTETRTS